MSETTKLKEQLTRGAAINNYDLDVLRMFKSSLGPTIYSDGMLEMTLRRVRSCARLGIKALELDGQQ